MTPCIALSFWGWGVTVFRLGKFKLQNQYTHAICQVLCFKTRRFRLATAEQHLDKRFLHCWRRKLKISPGGPIYCSTVFLCIWPRQVAIFHNMTPIFSLVSQASCCWNILKHRNTHNLHNYLMKCCCC